MESRRDAPNFFAGPYIDRRSEERELVTWLADARADPTARYLACSGGKALMRESDDRPSVAFLQGDHPLVATAGDSELVLLGWFRGARVVLLDLPATRGGESPGTRYEELRPLSGVLPLEEAGLLAYARALSIWRLRHRHCGVCGAPTVPEKAGHVLRCSNPACGHEVFPRIDPAIIVLVTDGERALLGRQPTWPAGRYSTIAGFVEPGESLEDAVAREVLEETGVRVALAEYHSSQPWPFPSSLMLGFQALADETSEIRLGGELDDARWFTREQIAAGLPLLPPPHAISYRLIAAWFDSGSTVPLAECRPGPAAGERPARHTGTAGT
jgi:NAD+ diphosphatase